MYYADSGGNPGRYRPWWTSFLAWLATIQGLESRELQYSRPSFEVHDSPQS